MGTLAPDESVELRYPDNLERTIKVARALRHVLWAPFWLLGLYSMLWLSRDEPLWVRSGFSICFLLPIIFEVCLRRIENVSLRLKDSKIVVNAATLTHVGADGEVLAAVSLTDMKTLWKRYSHHATGHCVCSVYVSKRTHDNPVVFTTYLENAKWLACEVLGEAEWPPSIPGG